MGWARGRSSDDRLLMIDYGRGPRRSSCVKRGSYRVSRRAYRVSLGMGVSGIFYLTPDGEHVMICSKLTILPWMGVADDG